MTHFCLLTKIIIGEIVNVWNGKYMFTLLVNNRYSITQITVEIKTLRYISFIKCKYYFIRVGQYNTLYLRNKLMFFVLSLIYASYHILSVKEEIHSCIPVFRESYRQHVRCSSFADSTNLLERWTFFSFDVNQTSTEIYRPWIEPKEHYYSRNRHYHCIHTRVVITNHNVLCRM